ncbi:NADP-dependent phosphogluconate dehydrogenase [Acidihalobacter prosperus]|uniref:6-phosphogluconate dehydrogenase, decarboxylating n=1 Tax=Acidihalobacter prosperus TaxID=160660 RepID=A0A1A6C8R3_9GAMM|nr:NADP-dependent phosphogluconate dehydrogenase [Acidihalobacter prosperus]OBS10946.1 phosphogluconate dehydrogenase (NADP(+)-dependent, decarboxylating) [Acidihalobacter prosperus]
MATSPFDIGVVGLGVMGANIALNLASHGTRVAGYNHTSEKAEAFSRRATNELGSSGVAIGSSDLPAFIRSLGTPRILLLMVPAAAVDEVLDELGAYLQPGDIVIDGGNSHYPDTERRLKQLAAQGLHFIGMGISGGESGARHGPSMMPGGEEAAWRHLRPLLEPAAAIATDGKPCVAWMGSGGAGHFVKMVHNGIEYAIMQLIAEVYDLLHRGGGLDNAHLHHLFASWREGPLASYLVEITADILIQPDDLGTGALLDRIRDQAGQKGTGRWTSEAAFDLGVPTPSIDAAVSARGLSGYYAERQHASRHLSGPLSTSPDSLQARLAGALEAGMLLAYAQGLHLISAANATYGYGTSQATVAHIWRGGCIIRAGMLETLAEAYVRNGHSANPIFEPGIAQRLGTLESDLRAVVAQGALGGIPLPAFSATLAYYDAWRSARLPANLTQAQRDYFGSHTYERLDRDGRFHTHWTQGGQAPGA